MPGNPVFESLDGVLFDMHQGMLMAYPAARAGTYAIRIIGMNAFYGCGKLTGITLPDSVTSIDEWAFKDCVNRRRAFCYCAGLTGISIPDTATSIGERA